MDVAAMETVFVDATCTATTSLLGAECVMHTLLLTIVFALLEDSLLHIQLQHTPVIRCCHTLGDNICTLDFYKLGGNI